MSKLSKPAQYLERESVGWKVRTSLFGKTDAFEVLEQLTMVERDTRVYDSCTTLNDWNFTRNSIKTGKLRYTVDYTSTALEQLKGYLIREFHQERNLFIIHLQSKTNAGKSKDLIGKYKINHDAFLIADFGAEGSIYVSAHPFKEVN